MTHPIESTQSVGTKLSLRQMLLQPNVGALDRGVRIVAGAGLLAVAFVGPETAWGYLGVIPLITGIVGTCPLYSLLGLKTRHGEPITHAH